MARKNAQTPKGTPTRAVNHKTTPTTRATTTMRMLDGKGNGTKKNGHGHKKDKAAAKTVTSTTTTSTTTKDKQRMAGINNHGMDGSNLATGQATPGGHKINNGSHRNNFNQMMTVQKAKERKISKEDNPRTTTQKREKSTFPTSPKWLHTSTWSS